ncbi:MAG TPA: Coq4 family protein [Caulobacteraceae bacterium]|nr:Coq4 family protein [Caulobacteraceae bacterium]
MTDMAIAVSRPATRLQRHRTRDWPAALRAFQRLMANKEDTSQVFAIMHALDGDACKYDYIRLLEMPDGGRIAYERPELSEKLMDDAWRASFPPGSVGAAYVKFLNDNKFSPEGMIDESHKGIPPAELERHHPYAWFFRRVRDLHDIWHVLTGYDRDALGEMCLVAFSFQETHGLGWALIAGGGFLRAHGPAAGKARRALLEARRRGKKAAWLPGEDYDKVLVEPLEAARARLGLTPPVAYEAVPRELRNLTII